MTKWYNAKPQLLCQERDRLAAAQPLMDFEVLDQGTRINKQVEPKEQCAVASGMYKLSVPGSCQHYRYQIALVLPGDYPRRPPAMYCDDPKLPIGNIDRHIMKTGQACLGVGVDVANRWRPEGGLVGFLDDLVARFLAFQLYFDTHGKPPPDWGERSHGIRGIVECYHDILRDVRRSDVVVFMKLLARKSRPKGHEWCP